LAALKRMFTLGVRARKVYSMPAFPHLEERNVRKGFIEDGQYQALAKACSAEGLWLRAMFEVGYNFGWRVSELLNMRVRQIDLASRTIRLEVGETKNDEGREVEMTPLVYALVQQCVTGKRGEDFVFTRESGKPVRDFRGAWEKVCKQAGVPELLFHDLRRTAVRNMVRRGIPERVAMTISGHKTRSIFDRYNIVSKSDLHEAAKKLALRDQERDEQHARLDTVQTQLGLAAAPLRPLQN
jgi:integrase